MIKDLKNTLKRAKAGMRRDILAPSELASRLQNFKKIDNNSKQIFQISLKYFDIRNLSLSKDFNSRTTFMAGISLLVLCLMLTRYAWLAILPSDLRDKLRTQSVKQFETEVVLSPPRAAITDRNGKTLAVTILRPSIFVVPKRLPKSKDKIIEIAHRLGVRSQDLEELSKSKKGFSWLRRKITPKELEAMGNLSQWRDFVGVIEEPKRIYPEKELASHLIGFVGMDNTGLEGIEGIYSKELNGQAETLPISRDARGHITLISPNGAVKPEPSLPPLQLSIDLSVQQITESALRDGVEKAKARGGSAVVMDSETGELLAIASYPTYDLNAPPEKSPERRRFRPVMDALELGSVVKPIFVAKALDLGIIHKDDKFFCNNGRLPIPGGVIRDDHPRGWISTSEIIKYSSNICTYKIVQKIGKPLFHEVVIHSGLARSTGTGLPGEWNGRISKPETWREMRFANMAFGQGLAISPLQLTHAITMITAGGEDKGVHILARKPRKNPFVGPHLRFISPTTSRLITEMMMSVVEEEGGTGGKAAIPGFSVAGKTGTAQKFSQKTKSYSERTSSFVGVLPADNPKLTIAVIIDEPQVRPAYGGTLAGPVFAEIGSQTIRYLNAQGFLTVENEKEVF